MEFKSFSQLVEAQFNKMAKGQLFVVDVDKTQIWKTYLASFPEGTNPIYKERREYDCQCCKQFVRNVGNVVSIKNGKLISVWDVKTEGHFQVVADKMAKTVKESSIRQAYFKTERTYGNQTSQQMTEEGVIDWNHFCARLPNSAVSSDAASKIGKAASDVQVFQRGLEEITQDSLEIVLDLILQKSLYRGEEFKAVVSSFQKAKLAYDKLRSDKTRNIFTWGQVGTKGFRIRNTAIGTLLQDLSEGKSINQAVASFESKVAPANYKRTSAPITKGMIKTAVAKIEELGLEPALHRRFSTIGDVSINNVLFADRSASVLMKDSLTSVLMADVKESSKTYDKVEDIDIEKFISDILPNIDSMEVKVAGKYTPNFTSLITSQQECANIFQWNNPFSWSYAGNVTDSIKQRIKNAGGNVEGVLRISLSWYNADDLDISVIEPDGNRIYYGNRNHYVTTGVLDVDMNVNRRDAEFPVENITWSNKSSMCRGNYKIEVHNYTSRDSTHVGFEVEVEYENKVQTFSFDKKLAGGKRMSIATVDFNGNEIAFKSINKQLSSEGVSKDFWGIQTEKFQKVSSMMLSPNFWDEQTIGNKHYFFMLENCENPEEARGIYNEFLRPELTEHRKVFELLADRFKCATIDDQLSGVGFSSTKRAELLCRVKGNFTRTLNIKF